MRDRKGWRQDRLAKYEKYAAFNRVSGRIRMMMMMMPAPPPGHYRYYDR